MKATRWTVLSLLAGLGLAGLSGCGGSKSGPHPAYAPSSPEYGYGPGAPAEADESADWSGGSGEAKSYSAPQGAPPPAPGEAPARSGYGADQASRRAPSADDPFSVQRERERRPGLATQWGENRYSRVSSAPFVRASFNSPFVVSKLMYNDRAGIDAMAGVRGGQRYYTDRFSLRGGYFDVGLRNENGHFYRGFTAGGQSYVTGEVGRRYTILIRNHTPGRIEALISVDGLDVIDGQSASFSKRGYLIDPHGRLEIEGFRRSQSQVAAFRFGSVSQSYAAKKHGDTRNVGVIGLAFFHERGDDPRYWRPGRYNDARDRHQADPFPQRYATPPH